MGNKLGRRRQGVDEKYTRPQGLYHIKDVDYKKLRNLILESKLAPCYPGGEEYDSGHLEECPICFLYYPTLNRSRCCMKSICTECFLQMKNPNSTLPTRCPFCKTPNYAVEYRGLKSKEEWCIEQIEEQKVIEAKIRMRQQELQDDQKLDKRLEISSSTGVENIDQSTSGGVEGQEVVCSLNSHAAPLPRQRLRQNRDDEVDLNLEDIMITEAIWLSIQENGRTRHVRCVNAAPRQYVVEDHAVSAAVTASSSGSSSSPSSGIACAIAALAERQQMGGESSSNYAGNMSAPDNMLPSSGGRNPKPKPWNHHLAESSNGTFCEESNGGGWVVDHSSAFPAAGTSYANSIELDDGVSATELPPPPPPEIPGAIYSGLAERRGSLGFISRPPPYGGAGNFSSFPCPIPESYEEQMMFAMAVSLSEARARTNAQGVSWQ
ncbi:hypothetical protein Nepgr_026079 [Nepenthes gracilis]|uniref:RING-type domain-containing protein n=1 Tax=Nepenthes gracilis TaxID=150966 RepID=A0AAD3T801_NEPGR|nr:hypothetical protein Nepgr_026079 [Nepenthes gracilis]